VVRDGPPVSIKFDGIESRSMAMSETESGKGTMALKLDLPWKGFRETEKKIEELTR
jgi:hypothetical protein